MHLRKACLGALGPRAELSLLFPYMTWPFSGVTLSQPVECQVQMLWTWQGPKFMGMTGFKIAFRFPRYQKCKFKYQQISILIMGYWFTDCTSVHWLTTNMVWQWLDQNCCLVEFPRNSVMFLLFTMILPYLDVALVETCADLFLCNPTRVGS